MEANFFPPLLLARHRQTKEGEKSWEGGDSLSTVAPKAVIARGHATTFIPLLYLVLSTNLAEKDTPSFLPPPPIPDLFFSPNPVVKIENVIPLLGKRGDTTFFSLKRRIKNLSCTFS